MNNRTTASLAPKLRFPEFKESASWNIKQLNELLVEAKKRNRDLELGPKEVLSVSGEFGCVNQIELLGRSYAGVSVKDYHVVENGNIVYTKSPLKRNPYGIIKENKGKRGIVSTLYAVYRPLPGCSPTYIDHFFSSDYNLNSYLQPIVKKGAKNDMKVNNADVLRGDICVPGITEQQKIADCLSSLDELIAAQARKVKALKTHKKGLMQQLFPREGETQPRQRFPEFRNADGWREVALGQLMTIKGRIGYRGYTVEDIVEAGEGAISLSPSNISATGTLSFEKVTYISWAKFYESPEIILEKNFTVLVKTGSTYGKVAFIRDLPHECTVNPQIVVLKPTSTNPYFLYLLISGEPIQSRIEATVVGGAIPTLSQESVSKFVVRVPSESEQQRIADCLTSLDTLITAVTQKLETLKNHKRGLMQQLFPLVEDIEV